MKSFLLYFNLLVSLFIIDNTQCQNSCFTDPLPNTDIEYINSVCSNLTNYYPTPGFNRTIKVNFIVIQDDAGNNNFNEQLHESYLEDGVDQLNLRFGSNPAPSDIMPGITELSNIGISFILEDIK